MKVLYGIALVAMTCHWVSALPTHVGDRNETTVEDTENQQEVVNEELNQKIPQQESGSPDVEQQEVRSGEIGSPTGDQLLHGDQEDVHKEGQESPKEVPVEGQGQVGVLTGDELLHGDEGGVHEEGQAVERAPAEDHGKTGVLTGDELLHGEEGEVHGDRHESEEKKGGEEEEEEEMLEIGVKTGDEMMHDGEEHTHHKGRAVADGENVNIGVLSAEEVMHGGEGGIHEDGHVKNVRKMPVDKTLDAEQLMHGADHDGIHDARKDQTKEAAKIVDTILGDDFMHNLMHNGKDHDDSKLKATKAVRPRDLLKLDLREEVLKGFDIQKIIREDMEEYNKFQLEQGGDSDSVWNIFNNFEFRYFKEDDIPDISSREPENEWDMTVLKRLQEEHKGEDNVVHMMESIGRTGTGNEEYAES